MIEYVKLFGDCVSYLIAFIGGCVAFALFFSYCINLTIKRVKMFYIFFEFCFYRKKFKAYLDSMKDRCPRAGND